MIQTETFRRQMPPPLQPRPLNLPVPIETTLPNGLGLVLIEDKRLPLISFRLAFRAGDANDPPELPGLSDMLAHLLTEGTDDADQPSAGRGDRDGWVRRFRLDQLLTLRLLLLRACRSLQMKFSSYWLTSLCARRFLKTKLTWRGKIHTRC